MAHNSFLNIQNFTNFCPSVGDTFLPWRNTKRVELCSINTGHNSIFQREQLSNSESIDFEQGIP